MFTCNDSRHGPFKHESFTCSMCDVLEDYRKEEEIWDLESQIEGLEAEVGSLRDERSLLKSKVEELEGYIRTLDK